MYLNILQCPIRLHSLLTYEYLLKYPRRGIKCIIITIWYYHIVCFFQTFTSSSIWFDIHHHSDLFSFSPQPILKPPLDPDFQLKVFFLGICSDSAFSLFILLTECLLSEISVHEQVGDPSHYTRATTVLPTHLSDSFYLITQRTVPYRISPHYLIVLIHQMWKAYTDRKAGMQGMKSFTLYNTTLHYITLHYTTLPTHSVFLCVSPSLCVSVSSSLCVSLCTLSIPIKNTFLTHQKKNISLSIT